MARLIHRSLFRRYSLRRASAGVAIVVVAALALQLTPQLADAAQAGPVRVGADAPTSWGPAGASSSDSAVTVRWDNTGNPSDSVVPRDSSQLVPHTGGKNYDDIAPKIRTGYEQQFGADNGLGGLTATVSQTQDLVNQAVTVSFSGAKSGQKAWLEVFQCWGAVGADGKPDPLATSPDPESCQVGVGGPDYAEPNFRGFTNDRLARTGDLTSSGQMPFRSISGQEEVNITQFNRVSTNEFSYFRAQDNGSGSRPFEMQTGAEAPGLGCGKRQDAPSTSSCWLVLVPMTDGTVIDTGIGSNGRSSGMAPTLWAQRMQVKLGFQDAAPTCPSGQAQVLSGGSEVLTGSMASWIPGICAATGTALGFSPLSDYQARQQLSGGSSRLAFGSQPATGTSLVSSPAALSGLVIAGTLDYRPCGMNTEVTQSLVERCGYSDLADAQANIDKTGTPITGLRLNARLVAKLLTQSYGGWSEGTGSSVAQRAPWVAEQPLGLFNDKEFLTLNPTWKHHKSEGGIPGPIYRLNVESLRSDAAHQLWTWLVNDPAAKGFLDGCADPDGIVINPFYSSRSYAECLDKSGELSSAAALKIEQTHSPVGFDQAQAQSYPPTTVAFPQVLWYQQDPTEIAGVKQDKATTVDLFPLSATMAAAARTTFIAAPPVATWCYGQDRPGAPCSSNRPDGEWKGIAKRQDFGTRSVLSVTTSADAAKFQIPTAEICDDEGTHCVGADQPSLEAALATGFERDAASGMYLPRATSNYEAGAYPLAMLVYGVVNTAGLDQTTADSLAAALEYIAGSGQTPGRRSGSLPPGYAPLSAQLVADAAVAVDTLRHPPAAAAPTAPVAAATAPRGPSSGVVPPAAQVPAVAAAASAPAPVNAPTTAAGGLTGATETGFPQAGLIGGLGAALLAALVSPFFGRRKKVTS